MEQQNRLVDALKELHYYAEASTPEFNELKKEVASELETIISNLEVAMESLLAKENESPI